TLKCPNHRDDSTILATIDATAPQTLSVTVQGGLSTRTVHVWTTNLNSTNPADQFVHSADIKPVGGKYTLTLQPGFLYSLTTKIGLVKGTAQGHPAKPLACPYTESIIH